MVNEMEVGDEFGVVAIIDLGEGGCPRLTDSLSESWGCAGQESVSQPRDIDADGEVIVPHTASWTEPKPGGSSLRGNRRDAAANSDLRVVPECWPRENEIHPLQNSLCETVCGGRVTGNMVLGRGSRLPTNAPHYNDDKDEPHNMDSFHSDLDKKSSYNGALQK